MTAKMSETHFDSVTPTNKERGFISPAQRTSIQLRSQAGGNEEMTLVGLQSMIIISILTYCGLSLAMKVIRLRELISYTLTPWKWEKKTEIQMLHIYREWKDEREGKMQTTSLAHAMLFPFHLMHRMGPSPWCNTYVRCRFRKPFSFSTSCQQIRVINTSDPGLDIMVLHTH